MDTYQVDLRDLLALLVRKIKPIILFTLICTLLLGGYQAYQQFCVSPSSVSDTDYIEALEDYETQKQALESKIAKTQSLIDAQEKYNRDSLLMQIDPGNVYTTTKYISVSVDDSSQPSYVIVNNTAKADDYQTIKVAKLYSAYWKTLDLSSALGTDVTKGLPDQYIRDVVSVSDISSGIIELTVIGTEASETETLADAVHDLLLASKPAVENNSYKHGFTLIGDSTTCTADSKLSELQQENYNIVNDIKVDLDDSKTELAALKAPALPEKQSVSSVVKWSLIGLFAGLFIACAWFICTNMLNGKVLSSNHARHSLNIEYLGKLASPSTGIAKCADSISGEPRWESLETAKQYVALASKFKLGDSGKVLVLSSLDVDESSAAVQALVNALKRSGYSVKFIGSAVSNPFVLSELSSCDGVILAEASGETKLESMTEIISKADIANKPIAGFVMI